MERTPNLGGELLTEDTGADLYTPVERKVRKDEGGHCGLSHSATAVFGATPELVERGMTPGVIFLRGSRDARWVAAFANKIGSSLPTLLANARVQPVSLSSPRKPSRQFLENLQ